LTSTENTEEKTEDLWDITHRPLAVSDVSDDYFIHLQCPAVHTPLLGMLACLTLKLPNPDHYLLRNYAS